MKCVEHSHVDLKGQTWCGRRVDPFEFAFQGADHAAENGRQQGSLVACRACVRKITEALKNGQ